jgi:protein required for attachment to host cells
VYYHLWILVADRSKARIFHRAKPSEGIHLVEEIIHPEGRLKEHEILSDRPGRTFSNVGTTRHGYAPRVDPLDQIGLNFAKVLASKLELARSQNRFERIVLVAAPKLLGMIRTSLDPKTQGLLLKSMDKDYSYQSDLEIIKQLDQSLQEMDRELGLEHTG